MCACECEKTQQSPHSPCVVADTESLVYCLIDPDHVDTENGTLKNLAFSKSQLRQGTLSIVRAAFASQAIVEENVIEPMVEKNPLREFDSCFLAECTDVREVQSSAERGVCVVDDGKSDFEGHAHLAFSEFVATSKPSVQVEVRSNLLLQFKKNGQLQLDEVSWG